MWSTELSAPLKSGPWLFQACSELRNNECTITKIYRSVPTLHLVGILDITSHCNRLRHNANRSESATIPSSCLRLSENSRVMIRARLIISLAWLRVECTRLTLQSVRSLFNNLLGILDMDTKLYSLTTRFQRITNCHHLLFIYRFLELSETRVMTRAPCRW